jgi:hypothetical protein
MGDENSGFQQKSERLLFDLAIWLRNQKSTRFFAIDRTPETFTVMFS